MRVLMIPSWYPPHGGMFFVHQAQGLIENGVDVTVGISRREGSQKI